MERPGQKELVGQRSDALAGVSTALQAGTVAGMQGGKKKMLRTMFSLVFAVIILMTGTSYGFEENIVAAWSFNKGSGNVARDISENGNDGMLTGGVEWGEGKFGKAIQFTGKSTAVKGFEVSHDWTSDLPIFARAMVLADITLFLAGPPDVIDEPEVFKQIAEPQVKAQIAKQAAALNGDQGAMLMAVSTESGQKLVEYKLDGVPIFDGMAVAVGKLFISMTDGRLICMQKQ